MPSSSRTEGARSYRGIADALRGDIGGGAIRPGSLLPTERELQTAFGVSRGTVRRALQALVESGWAESQPNRGVVALQGSSRPRSNMVAFVDHTDSVHRYLFFALTRCLATRNLHLVHVDSTTGGTEGALEYAHSRDFCAAVVWSKTGTPNASRITRVLGEMPIVAVDHGLRQIDTDLVTNAIHDGARAAIVHLATMGRRRVAVSGMLDGLDTTFERFAGYVAGIFASGASPDVRDFVFCHTSSMSESNTDALERRLRDPDRPDAVFVLQDSFTLAVIQAIRNAGLQIPADVAVVGIGNDFPIYLEDCALTTIAFDWDAVAEALTHLITERLVGGPKQTVTRALPVELVIRGSCGAPRELWTHRPYQPSTPPNDDRVLSRKPLEMLSA